MFVAPSLTWYTHKQSLFRNFEFISLSIGFCFCFVSFGFENYSDLYANLTAIKVLCKLKLSIIFLTCGLNRDFTPLALLTLFKKAKPECKQEKLVEVASSAYGYMGGWPIRIAHFAHVTYWRHKCPYMGMVWHVTPWNKEHTHTRVESTFLT